MADSNLDERALGQPKEFNIYGGMGCFTVDFPSPYNSIHQITGFKTEDAARDWIAETQILIGRKSH
jgi:hypothetical protein